MEIDKCIKPGKINAIFNINIKDFSNYIFVKEIKEDILVFDYIKKYVICSDDKIKNSFRLVNLNIDVINSNMKNLSTTEELKIELAIHLLRNEEVIYLYQFDKFFMEKDLSFYKKLFKKLAIKYNKTIIFLDVRFAFALDLVDRVIIKVGDSYKYYEHNEFYTNKVLKYVDIPSIVDFVNYVNQGGKVLDNYSDIKELIKAIYREV